MSIRYAADVAATSASAALVYARQSQDSDTSKTQQEAAGRARAEAEEWPIFAVYRDGTSASRHAKTKRTDWPKLLADLNKPEVGVLWLWESSRGDRTLSSWAAMLDRAREHGVKIYVETHGRLYDMANARDWRTLAEDGVDNAYESEKVSMRVLRAAAAHAEQGRPWGRTPFGYRRVYDVTSAGKRVIVAQVPHPDEAKVVRRIYRDIERGVSLRQIAKDVDATGVPTRNGGPWSPIRIRDIALNPTYIGKRVHNPGSKQGDRNGTATLSDAMWDGLASAEQFHNVRSLLTGCRRTNSMSTSPA
jgi:DNA invertase Pin-like site-specific DNA recombinase